MLYRTPVNVFDVGGGIPHCGHLLDGIAVEKVVRNDYRCGFQLDIRRVVITCRSQRIVHDPTRD